MKKNIVLILVLSFLFSFLSCSKPNNDKKKWKVLEKQEYKVKINAKKLSSNIYELEKLIFAPLFYFEKDKSVSGFDQEISYISKTKTDDKERVLNLSDTTRYRRDDKNNFDLIYKNNHNEGWEMIWKDNFLFRKLLGGEFMKTVSMGEHNFYKETQFAMLPDIYKIFRNFATIKNSQTAQLEGKDTKLITILFSNTKKTKKPLPKKTHLQNIFGLEEIRKETLTKKLSKQKKSQVNGTMKLWVTNNKILKMEINISFKLEKEKTLFSIKGYRNLILNQKLEVKTPPFKPEYHRRTLDATQNIMEKH